ncbi:hypothetical protein CCO02nite_31050 [Cellulomonas composti]|uniref:Uncharacterized protein n=1 Tax=Cellulomonas composti TaxID=266130 RepID=A0A511JEL2_9CELL|nr:hypothetical protein CCO02nite_31050 [Cellulomonas composti]
MSCLPTVDPIYQLTNVVCTACGGPYRVVCQGSGAGAGLFGGCGAAAGAAGDGQGDVGGDLAAGVGAVVDGVGVGVADAGQVLGRWIEETTGWSLRKFVKTTRRYRTIDIRVGQHTITAADLLPDDLTTALEAIKTRAAGH